jgi:glycosyltransferase involved in cell wall biosynthesis
MSAGDPSAASQPLVSIGLPVFNGAPSVRTAIESLLAQTYPHFELIISDNASTDATGRICQELAAHDGRIRYQRNPANLGAIANFHRVVHLARGAFFMWAAHDDWWDPEFIEANLKALCQDRTVIGCISKVQFEDANSLLWRTLWGRYGTGPLMGSVRSNLLRYLWHPGTNSRVYALYRRAVLLQCLEPISYWAGDTTFVVKTLRFGKYQEVNRCLLRRRRGASRDMRRYVRDHNAAGLAQLLPFWEGTRDILRCPQVPRNVWTYLCLFKLNAMHTAWYYKEWLGAALRQFA